MIKEKTGNTVESNNGPKNMAELMGFGDEVLNGDSAAKAKEGAGMDGNALGAVMSLVTSFGGVSGFSGAQPGPSFTPSSPSSQQTRQADEVPVTQTLAATMQGLAAAVQSGDIGNELKAGKAQTAHERSPAEVKADAKERIKMAEQFKKMTEPGKLTEAMEQAPAPAASAPDSPASAAFNGQGTQVTVHAALETRTIDDDIRSASRRAQQADIQSYKPEPSLHEQAVRAVSAPLTPQKIDMARAELVSMAMGDDIHLKLENVAAYRAIADQIQNDAKQVLAVQQVREEKGVTIEGGDVADAANKMSYEQQMAHLFGDQAKDIPSDAAQTVVRQMPKARVSGMNA